MTIRTKQTLSKTLELISDCMKLPIDIHSVKCTRRVLAEAEL